MSDLECPATLVLVAAGPGEPAAEVTAEIAALVREAPVAAAYVTGPVEASAAAGLLGGAGAHVVRTLSGEDLAEELAALADLHRGETVLVVALAEPVRTALARLLPRVPEGLGGAAGAVVALAADADGWVIARHNRPNRQEYA